jgi:stearoyl-CoA desaturase (delta-9 desaturase)
VNTAELEAVRTRRRLAATRLERRVALATVVTPLLGFIAAAASLWGRGLGPVDVGLCAGFYALTTIGITVGFHRLFAHRSFRAARAVEILLGIAGSMAAEGPVLFWVAAHRRHHKHSDREGDPHSPHLHGGAWAAVRGLFHAHIGWMVRHEPDDLDRYARDLLRDRTLVLWLNQPYFLWVGLGLLAPAAIGGALARSWAGALTGFLWGGLARIFLVHHVTWSVNSICHTFGTRPYDTRDASTNNPAIGLLAFGEGWHNNHHAFPYSARHGLAWWQLDASWLVIRALERLGLASDVATARLGEAPTRPEALTT